MYIYIYTLYRSQADQRRDHTSSYYRRPKKLFVLAHDGSSFLALDFPPAKVRFPLQGSQRVC